MSGSESIIDNLVIAPVALAPAIIASDSSAFNLSVSLQTPSERKLTLSSPFFVRAEIRNQASAAWGILCSILRRHGIPLFAQAVELDGVPVGDLPVRIAVRSIGQPIIKAELMTADALELSNCDAAGDHWGWPYEIEGSRDLKSFVQVFRDATQCDVPIGMSLPLGATASDMRACVESSVDFLTLKHSFQCLAHGQAASMAAVGVLNARKQCVQFGRPNLPLLLDAPLVDLEHIIKLLAMGATAVNVGKLISNAMPSDNPMQSESKLAESLLGGPVPATKSVRELPQVERTLRELVTRLKATLQFAGVIEINQFHSGCLRSLSNSVSEMTGIALLGNR